MAIGDRMEQACRPFQSKPMNHLQYNEIVSLYTLGFTFILFRVILTLD